MSAFLATSLAPQLDIRLLRRDFFDGVSFLLQDSDGVPFNLSDVQVCASIWKNTISGTVEQVTAFNIEEEEPLRNGQVRLWLSSSQTATLWDQAQYSIPSGVFYPSAYASQVRPFFSWDMRIERKEEVADLVSVTAGAFVSQTNHTLGATERVVFEGTTSSTINYDGTSARIYSNLTNITYAPPYAFTIAALSGITNAALGGSVYRLKQDTVAAGSVFVGTTFSNCFP
jgi:hypothetical protein